MLERTPVQGRPMPFSPASRVASLRHNLNEARQSLATLAADIGRAEGNLRQIKAETAIIAALIGR